MRYPTPASTGTKANARAARALGAVISATPKAAVSRTAPVARNACIPEPPTELRKVSGASLSAVHSADASMWHGTGQSNWTGDPPEDWCAGRVRPGEEPGAAGRSPAPSKAKIRQMADAR